MGLRPLGISLISNALGNILEKVGEVDPKKTICLLDIGAKQSSLCVFKGGRLEFNRDILTAGDNITQGLVRKITLPEKVVTINLEEAEKIKRQCGIPAKEELEEKVDFMTKSHVLAMLKPPLERLSTEITRSINYYRQLFKVTKVDKLYLSGGSARLKNIEKFLAVSLKDIEIKKLNPLAIMGGWSDPDIANEELLEELAPHLSVAFGLTLGTKKTAID